MASMTIYVALLLLCIVYTTAQNDGPTPGSAYCDVFPSYQSRLEDPNEPYVNVTFVNNHKITIVIQWINYDQGYTDMATLSAGDSVMVRSFPGHGFIARDVSLGRPVIIDYECMYEVREEEVQLAYIGMSPFCGSHAPYSTPDVQDPTVQITIFYNDHYGPVNLIWMNYQGNEQFQAELPAGGAYQVNADNVGNGWVARDLFGNLIVIDRKCLTIPALQRETRQFFIIGESSVNCPGVPHYNSRVITPQDVYKQVNFVNEHRRSVELYWIQTDSTARYFGTFAPGKAFEVNTYGADGWMVRDADTFKTISINGRCLFIANYDAREAAVIAERSCENARYVSPIDDSRLETNITFINTETRPVRIYWIDSNGTEQPYATIPAKEAVVQPTRESHGWTARIAEPSNTLNKMVRMGGNCFYIADGSYSQTAVIGDL